VLRLNAALIASGEKLFESLMSKPLDRHQTQCNLCGYVSQSGEYDDRIPESESDVETSEARKRMDSRFRED
jgi:hypothetical protein